MATPDKRTIAVEMLIRRAKAVVDAWDEDEVGQIDEELILDLRESLEALGVKDGNA
jgi:hypothetical protein